MNPSLSPSHILLYSQYFAAVYMFSSENVSLFLTLIKESHFHCADCSSLSTFISNVAVKSQRWISLQFQSFHFTCTWQLVVFHCLLCSLGGLEDLQISPGGICIHIPRGYIFAHKVLPGMYMYNICPWFYQKKFS